MISVAALSTTQGDLRDTQCHRAFIVKEQQIDELWYLVDRCEERVSVFSLKYEPQ